MDRRFEPCKTISYKDHPIVDDFYCCHVYINNGKLMVFCSDTNMMFDLAEYLTYHTVKI